MTPAASRDTQLCPVCEADPRVNVNIPAQVPIAAAQASAAKNQRSRAPTRRSNRCASEGISAPLELEHPPSRQDDHGAPRELDQVLRGGADRHPPVDGPGLRAYDHQLDVGRRAACDLGAEPCRK